MSERSTRRGPHPGHEGGGRAPASWAPWWPSGAHLLLYEGFYPGKNHEKPYGTKLRRHEAEPWRNQSRAPAELFCWGEFPPGGGNCRGGSKTDAKGWLKSGGGSRALVGSRGEVGMSGRGTPDIPRFGALRRDNTLVLPSVVG